MAGILAFVSNSPVAQGSSIKFADEVREYTDSDGKTWYLWYYRDLKLNLGNNKVSFRCIEVFQWR